MPYTTEWVSNEVAFEVDGVTVFHVYKNDDMSEGRRTYWFTLDENGNEADDAFDVRDLPVPPDYDGPRQPSRHLSTPAGWQGTYQAWRETDLYREINAEWNDYYAAGGEEPLIRARMEHAIRNKIGPFAQTEEAA